MSSNGVRMIEVLLRHMDVSAVSVNTAWDETRQYWLFRVAALFVNKVAALNLCCQSASEHRKYKYEKTSFCAVEHTSGFVVVYSVE